MEAGQQLVVAVDKGDLVKVKQLVDEGTNVNHRNDSGETPLMYACHNGHGEIAKVLLQNGADTTIRSNTIGASAMDYAKAKNHPYIVELLRQYQQE